MNTELRVEIITQSGVQCQGTASGIVVPGALGYLGIRPGHAPLMSSLTTGLVTLHQEEGDIYAAISGGIIEVSDDRAAILADVAEMAAEIDIPRTRQAIQRAEQRLQAAYEGPSVREGDVDIDRARLALARAVNRLHTADKAGLLG